MADRLRGKRALITGASRGIGAETALAFAREGADLVLIARSEEPLRTLQRTVQGMGRRAEAIIADLSTASGVGAAATSALAALGGLDIVVNNAGTPEAKPVTLLKGEPAEWDRIQRLNLDAALALLRVIGPSLREQKSGSVINVTSTLAHQSTAGLGAYAASKAALTSLTRTLAVEWGPSGVRVNALAPGPTETAMTQPVKSNPAFYEQIAQRTALKRWAKPSETAAAMVFLASDEASYITGHTLFVDGGLSVLHP